MDKAAIKTFAINSRRKLMEDVEYRMSLVGVTRDGIHDSITDAEGIQTFNIGGATHSIYDEDIKKRENLIKEVNNKGFENVVEEVAYTWFNRIIAIRYMEVNDYLPTRTRVLSSETPGKTEPDIITEAFNLDLDYTDEDKQHIFKLKDENKLDELFRFLFIKQCNKLNEILPGLFEKTEDYMELLLNISFVSADGVIRSLVDTISEQDFTDQVEIIGWIYQFYISELKEDTFEKLKKSVKISKERIPAATQLFTPDWIVKYMVENSVGKLWLEGHPNSELISRWEYYIEGAEQKPEVDLKLSKIRQGSSNLNPQDIKVIDPCMGSGHILVYVFDVLMQIYVSEGYTKKDAAENILKYNLYGLDIDDRAYQLAYFAVMMKARFYNRKIFSSENNILLSSIHESNNIDENLLNFIYEEYPQISADLKYLISKFKNAKDYGSLICVKSLDFNSLEEVLSNIESRRFKTIIDLNDLSMIKNIVKQGKLLSQSYDVTITNPPYMGKKSLNNDLKRFLDEYYDDVKIDLYSSFIKRCFEFTKTEGLCSMITIHTWMFIESYKKLREFLLQNSTFINMLHLGAATFEELNAFNVLATSFILRKIKLNGFYSVFIKLDDYLSKDEKINNLFNFENYFMISQDLFKIIPSYPFVYWVSENIRNNFKDNFSVKDKCDIKAGLQTGDNKLFVRFWHEVDYNKIGFNIHDSIETLSLNYKWFPYNKGGNFRKWYGNNEFILNYQNDGTDLKNFKKSVLRNQKYYFKRGITYSLFGFENFGVRYKDYGFLFDVSGSSIFVNDKYLLYVLAFLSSNVAFLFLSTLAPTVNFQVGNISNLPLKFDDDILDEVNKLANENIIISKEDWDNYETSWDFTYHPFLKFSSSNSLSESFKDFENICNQNYNKLKNNEEKINELFINLYKLNEDLTSAVRDKDIALNNANYEKDIKSFISYAVGCIFGRYSLDECGLQFAGGKFDKNKYSKFIPDDDNIIPVLDTAYFDDDIVGRFVEFIKVCFGEETLEENLDFIANALKKKGITSRDVIRNYFLNDFFKDHHKNYSKIPIYWQFTSGKENGFNCLVYMHRYDSSLVARVRTDYLHKTQKKIEENIDRCDNIINNSNVASEKSKATKEKNKLIKQLAETREYDEALAYIASQNIEIDLDDGVKVNYAKFQNVEVSKEGQKAKKINLLKKI